MIHQRLRERRKHLAFLLTPQEARDASSNVFPLSRGNTFNVFHIIKGAWLWAAGPPRPVPGGPVSDQQSGAGSLLPLTAGGVASTLRGTAGRGLHAEEQGGRGLHAERNRGAWLPH
ncbi:unnamed protein product [Arctogadus glacialis]